jgi:hypothetical protein
MWITLCLEVSHKRSFLRHHGPRPPFTAWTSTSGRGPGRVCGPVRLEGAPPDGVGDVEDSPREAVGKRGLGEHVDLDDEGRIEGRGRHRRILSRLGCTVSRGSGPNHPRRARAPIGQDDPSDGRQGVGPDPPHDEHG